MLGHSFLVNSQPLSKGGPTDASREGLMRDNVSALISVGPHLTLFTESVNRVMKLWCDATVDTTTNHTTHSY